LPSDWLNAAPASLLDIGLPDGLVEAREHVAEIEAHLNMAGIATAAAAGVTGEEFWTTFTDIVERVLASLDVAWRDPTPGR
jgi:hypothetical protein